MLTQVRRAPNGKAGGMSDVPAQATAPRGAHLIGADDLALCPLLGVAEVSQILGVPRATLYRWHSLSTPETGYGPRAFRVGRYLRYTLEDVRSYIEGLRALP